MGGIKKHLPNLLTLTNIALGLCAVLVLVQTNHPHKVTIAAFFVVFGGICDFFDGFLARKLGVASVMGKQLDSFADLVTFGVAPVALLNYACTCGMPWLTVSLSLLYVSAGAYRLARFNLADFSKHFIGLQIPAAGIALAIYGALLPHWAGFVSNATSAAVTSVFIVVLVILMVSKKKINRIGRIGN